MIVTATFDTENKSCVVTLDGKTLKNIDSFSVYKEYQPSNYKGDPEYYLNVSSSEELEDGLKKYTSLSAKEKLHESIASAIIGE